MRRLRWCRDHARSEGITQKPIWREPVRTHRAIAPASGYYEWQKVGSKKTPSFIHDAPYQE
ncbi:SOS response-associated peptidase family protein [Rathayibacter sp. KR2-224]|uniref:SOS response-associated peptidase family protein n=1 Tax=Rathayibacter sp. KR2-224 TaxID=3400913 RepID=UPI003C017C66